MARGHLRAVGSLPAPTTLVDSCVLLDLINDDPDWREWSAAALESSAHEGAIVLNPIVYAEVSVRFARIEEVEAALPADEFIREELPFDAGFLAGKAYLDYRQRGGGKRSPLPDFYIGAHAAVRSHRLLTRDVNRYRSYFPSVRIIAPE